MLDTSKWFNIFSIVFLNKFDFDSDPDLDTDPELPEKSDPE